MSLIIIRLETSIYIGVSTQFEGEVKGKKKYNYHMFIYIYSIFYVLRATATLKIGYVLPVIVLIEEIGCEQLGCILEPQSTAMTRTRGGLFGFRTTSTITCLFILLKPKFSYSISLILLLYIFIILNIKFLQYVILNINIYMIFYEH